MLRQPGTNPEHEFTIATPASIQIAQHQELDQGHQVASREETQFYRCLLGGSCSGVWIVVAEDADIVGPVLRRFTLPIATDVAMTDLSWNKNDGNQWNMLYISETYYIRQQNIKQKKSNSEKS